MRIHVTFVDRVGITQEVLALLGVRNLNLDAVEMIPPNVYIDAPTLSAVALDELHAALLRVVGVQEVALVDFLPGHRQRLQLEALLAAMSDPVLAVDPGDPVLHDNTEGLGALLGESAVLKALKARLYKVASLEAPLLIQGETGTGKELVARACHALSARRDASFLALNCAALPESLAESELFGYAAGAFTGAQRGGKPGLLELADGGTVFLDELGEMSPYLQAKLLRFLNDGSFRRVGGGSEVRVNVRVVCATHRNLESMVVEGSFREDLYYRLNVLNLKVPPLRERGKDILLLAEHFLRQACTQIQRSPCRLALATHPLLLGNRWPGNVRQLQNVIFRAAAISEGQVIDCDDLELAGTALSSQQSDGLEIVSLEAAVQGFEKSLLEKLYASYPSTRQLAVRLQTSHTAIGQRLRKYGIASRVS